jgi:hypothetical protein
MANGIVLGIHLLLLAWPVDVGWVGVTSAVPCSMKYDSRRRPGIVFYLGIRRQEATPEEEATNKYE